MAKRILLNSARSLARSVQPKYCSQRLTFSLGASAYKPNYVNNLCRKHFSTHTQHKDEEEEEYLLSEGKVPMFEDPTKVVKPLLNDMKIDLNTDWNDWKCISKEYGKVLPYYINDFVTYIAARTSDPIIRNEILTRIQRMLYKTGVGGKNNRAVLAIKSLFHLKRFMYEKDYSNNNESENNELMKSEMNENESNFYNKYHLTSIDLHNAFTVACAIESLQSYFLVLDDMMDGSETRRNAPCWYRQPGVGIKAINDGPIIESFVFWLINHRILNFDEKYTILPPTHDASKMENRNDKIMSAVSSPHMLLIDKLFREVKLQTALGQSIDLELVSDASKLKEQYTMERYESIVIYKTSFYTFYLPYACALYLSGYNDVINDSKKEDDSQCKLFHIARQLGMEIGIKFQIDDDYLDCFGDPNITGKVGTDIQDFKCSWLIVQALKECSDQQFDDIICKHYGKDNKESIEKIKQLYRDLKLPQLFEMNETKLTEKITKLIAQSSNKLPKEMFQEILDKLAHRKK